MLFVSFASFISFSDGRNLSIDLLVFSASLFVSFLDTEPCCGRGVFQSLPGLEGDIPIFTELVVRGKASVPGCEDLGDKVAAIFSSAFFNASAIAIVVFFRGLRDSLSLYCVYPASWLYIYPAIAVPFWHLLS